MIKKMTDVQEIIEDLKKGNIVHATDGAYFYNNEKSSYKFGWMGHHDTGTSWNEEKDIKKFIWRNRKFINQSGI